jgi:hypothetical protein
MKATWIPGVDREQTEEEKRAIQEALAKYEEALRRPPPTIHYSQMAPASGEGPIDREYETFRREVGRLLAEGHEGKWVLIKGDQIIGLYGSKDEALGAGYARFHQTGFFVDHILTNMPVVRLPWKYFLPCPKTPTP